MVVSAFAAVPHVPGHNYWWYFGLTVGFAVVLVVVIIAASILALASKIGAQARTAIDVMDQARENTLAVWEIQQTNVTLTGIWRAAEAAREALQTQKAEDFR